jgi:hypothetical protein
MVGIGKTLRRLPPTRRKDIKCVAKQDSVFFEEPNLAEREEQCCTYRTTCQRISQWNNQFNSNPASVVATVLQVRPSIN